MINGIASLVQGEGSRKLGASMWLVHAGAGAIGGAMMVAVVWLVLTPIRTLAPDPVALTLVIGVAAITLLAEIGWFKIPRQPRQVPQTWYERYGANQSYALFGLWLGAALATNVTYAVEYLVFVAAGLLLPLPAAVIGGAAFGFGRTALVGPFGLFPAVAAWWGRVYGGGRASLSTVSGSISLGLATGLVFSYLLG